MSWSKWTETIRKTDADKVLDELVMLAPYEQLDQFATAKRAAKEILKTIPGPFVKIQLSGHANGTGWQKKDGYANDCIQVGVTQFCNEELTDADRSRLGMEHTALTEDSDAV